jgi:hypothetical protein
MTWLDNKVHVIHYIRGRENGKSEDILWKFWLKFDVSKWIKKYNNVVMFLNFDFFFQIMLDFENEEGISYF